MTSTNKALFQPYTFRKGIIAELILEYVNDRVPVIAAGGVKKPGDANKAIGMGLTLVAIGQALVINPKWVELAVKGEEVGETLSLTRLSELAIPQKLWSVIDAAEGWFQVTA